MIRSFTVEQLRVAEVRALAATPHGALMRRAAWAVAAAAAEQLPAPVQESRAVLLVGGGNNGGDALYAGAALRRRGVTVTAVLADPDRAHAAGLNAARRAGVAVMGGLSDGVDAALDSADIVIDGLVGIGARPPLRETAADLVTAANDAAGRRIAIDVPSGVDPDTGWAPGPAFRADLTVALGGRTTGLLVSAAAGEVRLAGIGMGTDGIDVDTEALTSDDARRLLPRPDARSNKYTLGATGIVAGSARYPGAAVLAVGGAVAARPGLVRYAGHGAQAVIQRWPEVIVTDDVAQAGQVQAWVAGPGMGTDGAALKALRDVLATSVPVLVDADGLTLLAAQPWLLAERAARGAATVLTPHEGEFARLFPDLDPAGPGGRVAAARSAAALSGAVVLLKGFSTVVADPSGTVYVNLSGSPSLATAGSGDVLSGLAGALLSTGLDPALAAALAAYQHGVAGQRAAAAGRSGASALLEFIGVTGADVPTSGAGPRAEI